MTLALPSFGRGAGRPSLLERISRRIQITLVLLAVWQIISLLAGGTYAGANMVPSPADVLRAVKLLGNYWPGWFGLERTATGVELTWSHAILAFFYNSGLTILRATTGMLVGVIVGVGFAAIVSWSSAIRQMAALPAHTARMLPLLALVPLFNLWFGNTEFAVLLFVALVTFCVMFASALNAIATVPPDYANYARSLGAGRLRIYLTVILPAALPRISVGILIAHGFAWGGVIAAEFLGVQYGLGRIVMMAQEFNQFGLLTVAAIITVSFAIMSNRLVSRLLKRITRWA